MGDSYVSNKLLGIKVDKTFDIENIFLHEYYNNIPYGIELERLEKHVLLKIADDIRSLINSVQRYSNEDCVYLIDVLNEQYNRVIKVQSREPFDTDSYFEINWETRNATYCVVLTAIEFVKRFNEPVFNDFLVLLLDYLNIAKKIYCQNIKSKIDQNIFEEIKDKITFGKFHNDMLNVFLSYSSVDENATSWIYDILTSHKINVWYDKKSLLPGQIWELEIKKAISKSDVVIICFSNRSIIRPGYYHKEIRLSLDVANNQPEGTIFIIPVLLEECPLPESLTHIQYIRINENEGMDKLLNALYQRAKAIGKNAF